MIKLNSKDITPMMNGVQLSRVMYNGKQVWPEPMNVVEVQLSDAVAGDVCAYDGSNKRFFRFVDSGATDNIRNYTPIGVMVVPASHNVYGDGSCGVMSLKPMSCDTPLTGGTSEQSIYWGEYGTDISALPNLDQVPIVGSGSNVGNASSTVTGEEYYAYLPSDKFSAVQCPHDTDAYYYGSYDQAPSSYLTDGSRNPAYYQTSSPSSSNNALADFDGIGNTKKIIAQRGAKDYNSWAPGRTTEADYPAASCCDMFHTEGTSQGDWYLPACGELGYIMPPFNKINDAIGKMRTAYGSSVVVELGAGGYYWSSTEYSSDYARGVRTNNGSVNRYNKYNGNYVRAWLRVSPLDQSGVSPSEASNGVYVYANNGKLYIPEEWDTANNDLAVGVAVVTDNCKFCISKAADSSDKMIWSDVLATTDIPEISEDMNDLNGLINSSIIRQLASSENETNNAAMYCYSQTITVGEDIINGYLPAIGEWREASDNKDAIENALNLIGGIVPQPASHWSSTEDNIGSSKIYSQGLNWGNGGMVSNDRNMGYMYVRPFFPIVHDSYISANKAPDGVYIYDKSGALWKYDKWNTGANSFALGVAVITDNCRFVIDKTERNIGIVWSNELYGTDVSGILSTTDSTTARTDYAGENNSRLIREAASGENSSNNAAHWCYAQTITVNGVTKHGYLAALGEWQAAYDNKSAVDSALSKIGGVAMIAGHPWSSTEASADRAWILIWAAGILDGDYKYNTGYAVPMYSLD